MVVSHTALTSRLGEVYKVFLSKGVGDWADTRRESVANMMDSENRFILSVRSKELC